MLAWLSHQWKHISLLLLSWNRGVERSPIWVTATNHWYIPPKGTRHPGDPQGASHDLPQSKSMNLVENITKLRTKGKLGWREPGSCVRPVAGGHRVHLACDGHGVQPSPRGQLWGWSEVSAEGLGPQLRPQASLQGRWHNGVSFSAMSFGWSLLFAPFSEVLYWVGWPQGKALKKQAERGNLFLPHTLTPGMPDGL